MNTPRFSRMKRSDFSKTLKKRVAAHFKSHQVSRQANGSMIGKTVLMLSLFLVPFVFISTGMVTQAWLLFLLYIISGLGMAGIGMGVMHDAIHGAYSKNKKVNKYLGYTMNLVGANATVWKIQHNVLHHTYTNIHEADDDLNMPFFLKFSPHVKNYKIHRFQHLYVWFFYSISTLGWVTAKDFVRIGRYRKMGFLDKKGEFKKELFKLTGWKLLYFSFALALPLIFVPLPVWVILLAFVSMHLVTGLLISCIFQVAHVMPKMEYPVVDENGMVENEWTVHQLETTTNFSPKSKLFSWFIGGLNYQVEHHLFPNICHVHYRKISPIVAQTAKEFGIPYHIKKTFASAIWGHVKMLYFLGRMEKPVLVEAS